MLKKCLGRDRRLDRMDEIKMKIDFAMDFDQFKNKISETQVYPETPLTKLYFPRILYKLIFFSRQFL